MRVLFDITHPAVVHFFRLLVQDFAAEGASVLVASRDKDVLRLLLDRYDIAHTCISRKRKYAAGPFLELLERDVALLRLARQFRPDVIVGGDGAVTAVHVGRLLGVPSVLFDQVDHAPLQRALSLPFASVVCTSEDYDGDCGKRHVRFRGFLNQSYLAPGRFTPDRAILAEAGLRKEEAFAVVRLVGWAAAHDAGRGKTPVAQVLAAVEQLAARVRVLISSETPLPAQLAGHSISLDPSRFHDLLAFASVCLSEGGTVPAEAGLLGTPSISFNSYPFGYIRALTERGIIVAASDITDATEKALAVLSDPDARPHAQARRAALYETTDDVIAVMKRTISAVATGGRP